MHLPRRALIALTFAAAAATAICQSTPAGPFRVGAAKVDITPTGEDMPKNMLGVLDKLYSRAIVIDNGHTSAALITIDWGVMMDADYATVSSRIEKELGIPAVNVLVTATHTHASPMRGSPHYLDNVVLSAKLAKDKLQPARIGYGTGVSYINVQRDNLDPKTHGWWEGANYGGASDKTVAVIKFVTPEGKPIAVYYNYGVHAVITGVLNMISADIPGATSTYLENALGNDAVAVWSTGANGDQNPIFFQQTYDLREIRVKDYAKRGIDISNAMPNNGEGLDRSNPEVVRLMNEQKQMIVSMGQMLGEEVLRVVRENDKTVADGRIFGKDTSITCPGRTRVGAGRGGVQGTYTDGPDTHIRIGLLMLDDIAIGEINAEPYTVIAQRFKRESPYAKTLLATLTKGFEMYGYIPDDASYGHQTFEVLSSKIKPGCAETGIVEGIIDMMPRIAY